jgi:hypothetical protein
MKCCASPTISIAARPGVAAPVTASDERRVVSMFEAVLLAKACEPISKALGIIGDVVVERCAQQIMR